MATVALELAQRTLPELVEDVVLGRRVVITRDERPVAELVPAATGKPRGIFGSARGMISMADDFDAPLDDFHGYVR